MRALVSAKTPPVPFESLKHAQRKRSGLPSLKATAATATIAPHVMKKSSRHKRSVHPRFCLKIASEDASFVQQLPIERKIE